MQNNKMNKISLLVAYQNDRGIGYRNRLPWKLKADMHHFRELTLSNTIIMGRRTYESIGRPLELRRNIVISQTLTSPSEGIEVYPSLQEALMQIDPKEEIFIIGGERLFEEALPIADRLYLTTVEASEPVDRFFPPFDEDQWALEKEVLVAADNCNQFPHQIKTLIRKNSFRLFQKDGV